MKPSRVPSHALRIIKWLFVCHADDNLITAHRRKMFSRASLARSRIHKLCRVMRWKWVGKGIFKIICKLYFLLQGKIAANEHHSFLFSQRVHYSLIKENLYFVLSSFSGTRTFPCDLFLFSFFFLLFSLLISFTLSISTSLLSITPRITELLLTDDFVRMTGLCSKSCHDIVSPQIF